MYCFKPHVTEICSYWLFGLKTGVDVVELGIDVVPSSVLKCLMYCGGT